MKNITIREIAIAKPRKMCSNNPSSHSGIRGYNGEKKEERTFLIEVGDMMRLEKSAMGEVALLKVTGSISFSDVSTLKSALHRIVKEGKNKIVVDCHQMDSLNSKALAIFLSAYKSLQGGTIAFAGANEHVARVFHTTNLDSMFPLFDTVESAVESVK